MAGPAVALHQNFFRYNSRRQAHTRPLHRHVVSGVVFDRARGRAWNAVCLFQFRLWAFGSRTGRPRRNRFRIPGDRPCCQAAPGHGEHAHCADASMQSRYAVGRDEKLARVNLPPALAGGGLFVRPPTICCASWAPLGAGARFCLDVEDAAPRRQAGNARRRGLVRDGRAKRRSGLKGWRRPGLYEFSRLHAQEPQRRDAAGERAGRNAGPWQAYAGPGSALADIAEPANPLPIWQQSSPIIPLGKPSSIFTCRRNAPWGSIGTCVMPKRACTSLRGKRRTPLCRHLYASPLKPGEAFFLTAS